MSTQIILNKQFHIARFTTNPGAWCPTEGEWLFEFYSKHLGWAIVFHNKDGTFCVHRGATHLVFETKLEMLLLVPDSILTGVLRNIASI